MTSIRTVREIADFAEAALKDFEANPEHATYGEVKPGELLAIRWGISGESVRVLRIDCDTPVQTYWR